MNDERTLLGLEEAGWQALSTPGAGAEFYDRVLDDTAVMLLPGGLRLEDRDAILTSMTGPPWTSYRLESPEVLLPSSGTGLVVYAVTARRDSDEYAALVSSLYVRRGDRWRMVLHQQTPR